MGSSFEALSPEIFIHVLSYLSVEDLVCVGRINTYWFALTKDRALYGKFARVFRLAIADGADPESDIARLKCVDYAMVQKNWERNRYTQQTLCMHSSFLLVSNFPCSGTFKECILAFIQTKHTCEWI